MQYFGTPTTRVTTDLNSELAKKEEIMKAILTVGVSASGKRQ